MPTAGGWTAWDTPESLAFPAGTSAFHPAFLNQYKSWANTLFGISGAFYANGTPLFQTGTVFGGMGLGTPVSGDIRDFAPESGAWRNVANLVAGGTVSMARDVGNPYASADWQWCRANGVIDADGHVSLLVGEEIQPNSAFALAALVHLRKVLDSFTCAVGRAGYYTARTCVVSRNWDYETGSWGPNQTSEGDTPDLAEVPNFYQAPASAYARYPIRIRFPNGERGKIALLTQHTLTPRYDPVPPHHCDEGCSSSDRAVHGPHATGNNWFVAGVFDLVTDTGEYTKCVLPQGSCWQDVMPLDDSPDSTSWRGCEMSVKHLWMPGDIPESLPPVAYRVPYGAGQ